MTTQPQSLPFPLNHYEPIDLDAAADGPVEQQQLPLRGHRWRPDRKARASGLRHVREIREQLHGEAA